MVTIIKCQCGHPSCNYYGVSNGTFNQGNGWSKDDAEFVAWCFNNEQAIKIRCETIEHSTRILNGDS